MEGAAPGGRPVQPQTISHLAQLVGKGKVGAAEAVVLVSVNVIWLTSRTSHRLAVRSPGTAGLSRDRGSVVPKVKLHLTTRELLYFFFFFFCLFRAIPMTYGGSQARGLIGAAGGPTPEPQQRRIQAMSTTYTTAQGNAGS